MNEGIRRHIMKAKENETEEKKKVVSETGTKEERMKTKDRKRRRNGVRKKDMKNE